MDQYSANYIVISSLVLLLTLNVSISSKNYLQVHTHNTWAVHLEMVQGQLLNSMQIRRQGMADHLMFNTQENKMPHNMYTIYIYI